MERDVLNSLHTDEGTPLGRFAPLGRQQSAACNKCALNTSLTHEHASMHGLQNKEIPLTIARLGLNKHGATKDQDTKT